MNTNYLYIIITITMIYLGRKYKHLIARKKIGLKYSKPKNKRERKIIDMYNTLRIQHGLTDWECVINSRCTTTGGRCLLATKQLEISKFIINKTKATDKDIKDIILHEITHALGYLSHDSKFKQKLLSIGGNGKTYHPWKKIK